MRKLLPWFLVLVPWSSLAQPALAQDICPRPRRPERGKPEPLGLVGLKFETRLERLYGRYYGHHDVRQLPGPFRPRATYYPLPEGATVTGYALDIHGKWSTA